MGRKIKIAPSILSADFARLGEQVKLAESAGADVIHIDVMDGHFVPNISIGPLVVSALNKITDLPLDTHLMIENPEKYLRSFTEAGSDWLSVHIETCPNADRIIQKIKSLGLKAGVAINPETPLERLDSILEQVDFVLVMSVHPGLDGQSFIPESLEKLKLLRTKIDQSGLKVDIEVDGGISKKNALEVAEAGADILVAGAAVFKNLEDTIVEAIQNLKQAVSGISSRSNL